MTSMEYIAEMCKTKHYTQMREWMNEWFGKDKPLVGLEIGIERGVMEQTLLNEFPLLFMYGIDKIPRAYGHERFNLLTMSSDSAVIHFKPQQLDFVYIDGCHDYPQVRKDILNYAPFVKDDGIVAGHDYVPNTTNPDDGVTRAVDELFDKDKVHFGEDLAWWIYKRDIKW